ncbi:uncharacterized protein LOC144633224 [Oculina patagonica]
MRSNTIALYLSLFSIWLLVFAAPCLGKDLKCYLCYSNKSWDECEENERPHECFPEHDEVCIKQHVVEHENTEKGYKESFVKMCGKANLCTDKDCERHSRACQIYCCHSDLCNTSTRQNAHVTKTLLGTVVLLYLFQLGFIF